MTGIFIVGLLRFIILFRLVILGICYTVSYQESTSNRMRLRLVLAVTALCPLPSTKTEVVTILSVIISAILAANKSANEFF
jgi:hypothetical protein